MLGDARTCKTHLTEQYWDLTPTCTLRDVPVFAG